MRRTAIVFSTLIVAAFAVAATATARQADRTAPEAATIQTTAALDDATIVAIFDAANTADIETGRLAAERGHSKEVREFGQMLVEAHTGVRQMGRDLAAKLKVTPTPPKDDPSAAAHAKALEMLRSKSGAEFDRAFLRHEVEFHAAVIDAVQTTLLPAIKNPELRQLVTGIAPAFESHRAAAAALEKKLAENQE
jgi:putative membrane protein